MSPVAWTMCAVSAMVSTLIALGRWEGLSWGAVLTHSACMGIWFLLTSAADNMGAFPFGMLLCMVGSAWPVPHVSFRIYFGEWP